MEFKHVIPVGDNCEISSHLVRNNFRESSLFRFARSELEQIIKVISNDFQFVYEDISIFNDTLIIDNFYNIKWHSEIPLSNENYHDVYTRELKKINHLIDNTKNILNSDDNILFIYKSNEGYFEYIERFVNLVEEYRSGKDFRLLVVKTKNQHIQNHNDSRILIEDVDFLADYNRAMKGGDNNSWDRLLRNYLEFN